MAFNIEDHMSRMRREVARGERNGTETIIVRAGRVYPTDAHDLWDAFTNRERLSRWFLPVTGDLRLGGRYQFEGNAGGSIEQCESPELIRVTWEYGGGVSWLTLRFTPEANGTRLELEHESPVMPGFTDKFGPGAVGVGWDGGFMGLAMHLESPETFPTPPENEQWMASTEGKAFYGRSAREWGRAAIAAGTPEREALAQAEETRAFYTGETPRHDDGGGQDSPSN